MASTSDDRREYFLVIAGKQHGPYELSALREVLVGPSILVWHRGLAKWQPAEQLPELRDMLGTKSIGDAQHVSGRSNSNLPPSRAPTARLTADKTVPNMSGAKAGAPSSRQEENSSAAGGGTGIIVIVVALLLALLKNWSKIAPAFAPPQTQPAVQTSRK